MARGQRARRRPGGASARLALASPAPAAWTCALSVVGVGGVPAGRSHVCFLSINFIESPAFTNKREPDDTSSTSQRRLHTSRRGRATHTERQHASHNHLLAAIDRPSHGALEPARRQFMCTLHSLSLCVTPRVPQTVRAPPRARQRNAYAMRHTKPAAHRATRDATHAQSGALSGLL